MTPEQVIRHFKTQTAAAHVIGVAQASVALWVRNGRVPRLRQAHIQLITGGRLIADLRTAEEVS